MVVVHPVDGGAVLLRTDLDDLSRMVPHVGLTEHALPPGAPTGSLHPVHNQDHNHSQAYTHHGPHDPCQQDVRISLCELQVSDFKLQVSYFDLEYSHEEPLKLIGYYPEEVFKLKKKSRCLS